MDDKVVRLPLTRPSQTCDSDPAMRFGSFDAIGPDLLKLIAVSLGALYSEANPTYGGSNTFHLVLWFDEQPENAEEKVAKVFVILAELWEGELKVEGDWEGDHELSRVDIVFTFGC